MSAHHCPTCGCPVRIGGKGTTHYYVPISSKAADALLSAAKNYEYAVETRLVNESGRQAIDRRKHFASVLRKAVAKYEESS